MYVCDCYLDRIHRLKHFLACLPFKSQLLAFIHLKFQSPGVHKRVLSVLDALGRLSFTMYRGLLQLGNSEGFDLEAGPQSSRLFS